MSTQMEQPFYHDDSFLSAYGPSDAAMHDSYKLLKQNMNLNLNLTEPSYRSLKSQLYQAHAHAHAHQDAHGSLKLASPELERLIIQNGNGGVITTPTPAPGQYFYNRGITDEQEGFAEGFVKALDELHKINQVQMPPPPPNVSLGSGGVSSASSSVFGSSLQQPEPPIYTTLNAYCPNAASLSSSSSSYPTATISYLPPSHHHHHQQSHLLPQSTAGGAHLFQHPGGSSALLPPHPNRLALLKEEPQTVPDLLSDDGSGFGSPLPPMSPIDMADQERIKTERKRLRNRLAATKCRKRKLERISRLEDKVKALKSDNAGLSGSALLLRDQVARLKHKVLTHVGSGCQLMLTSKMEAF